MDAPIFITIITAIAALIGAVSPIVVTLIQAKANKEKENSEKTKDGILLPSNVVLHRPQKPQMRWLVILFFAFLGGIVGYGGANLVSSKPSNETPAFALTFPVASESPEPTMMPSSAPYASVIIFSVMQDGKVIDTVKPNETTNKMVVGSKVDIRAEVSSNIALSDLKFTWYTCQIGDHIWKWGDGVFEISYEVPNMAADCIRVKIEKGDTVLSNNIIHINVQK